MTLPINQIICGDNVETLKTFPDACIDLVVTSPPYDNLRSYGGHSWDFEGVAEQLTRVLKPGGVIVWVVGDATINGSETLTSFRQAIHFKDVCGLNVHDTMIWNQRESSMPDSVRYWDSFEFMFVYSKGKPKSVNQIKDKKNKHSGVSNGSGVKKIGMGEKTRTRWQGEYGEFGVRFNVWDMFCERSLHGKHPAPFPEALARDHIRSWSNENDIVLDPFNGSGTTTKMAREMGRRYIGIEINEPYCEIARKLIQQGLLFGEAEPAECQRDLMESLS